MGKQHFRRPIVAPSIEADISGATGSIGSAEIAAQAVTMAKLARGTNGQVIVANTGADPAYVSVSGDVTLSAAGAVAIGAQKVTMAMLARGTNGQVIVANTGADPAYVTISGDITLAANGTAAIGAQKVLASMLFRGTNGQILVANTGADSAYVSVSGDATLAANGALTLGAVVDGSKAANVADANVIGGAPVLHRIDIAAGALADTDVVLTHKTRVIDAWLVLRGAGVATTTLQVKNGATAITDAMAASGSDQAVVRAASIDDAAYEIAAAGTLRVTSATGASQPDATVYVLGIRVA